MGLRDDLLLHLKAFEIKATQTYKGTHVRTHVKSYIRTHIKVVI